ncbi:hypothetical protein GCM10027034_23860 [Ramlibacter solisilvae]|uniref:Uncharacterized protein n=1 Tax=Ramlibacter tataouinensis TaxID=94132 RepID=A0A127JQ41_9BURK|nr:hypothetical protein [Ramlibacter tataouinensis]AMO22090.1 hypothetical protein UC35_03350 [Ramlibacter tataouinensis]
MAPASAPARPARPIAPWRAAQLWYLPLLGTAMALMMARILVMARLLDVAAFGIYSAGLLVSTTFCMLACLGLQSLLQRDMPVMAARGRVRRALVLLFQSALVACLCAVVLLLIPALGVGAAGLSAPVFAIAIVHGLSQQVFLVATTESRSLGQPVRYSLQNLGRAVSVTALSAAAASLSGSAPLALGVEAAMSLALSAATLSRMAAAHGARAPTLLAAAWRTIRRARWNTALIFLGISLAASAVLTADRWFAAALLPAREFAQYAFAGVLVLIAQSTQAMLNASIYPALARRYALQGAAPTYALSARVSLSLLGAAVLLAVPAGLALSAAVQRWYPAYEPALAILWPVLAAGALRLSDFWSSFLTICGHERKMLWLQLLVGGGLCAVWAAALAMRGAAATLADFAWLALLLSIGMHGGAALAATRAQRKGAVA